MDNISFPQVVNSQSSYKNHPYGSNGSVSDYGTGKSTHYIFGHFVDGRFNTYNLNNRYDDIRDYLKENDTVEKLFAVYGVDKL